jgi:predicted aconitase with swiveling domain
MTAILVGGEAEGEVLTLGAPLSFWGGYDPEEGRIIDVHHPQHGESLAGKILAMTHGRGSSSSSAVLAEALRLGTGPAAIVLEEADQILVTGVLVARMLYGVTCPVVVAEISDSGRWRVSDRGIEPSG